jgi:ankyrin repeat protein
VTEPDLPPLYHASVANDLAEVRRLLDAGADPNDGESVYHAAEKNHRAVIDLLIAHGCDISSAHAVYGNTPLFFLAHHIDDEGGRAAWHQGMAYLLERGANPNVPSLKTSDTPLHQISTAPAVAATVKLLLDHGADPLARNSEGVTPYMVAVRNGNRETARLIEERGGAVPLSPEDEFLGACRAGDELRARDLLDRDPGLRRLVSQPQALDGTPLHWAAWTGNPAAVRTLISLGADVNQRDGQFGSSPLGWAGHGSCACRRADDDYCAVVDMLRAAGATREASVNKWGETPEGMASPRVAERLTQ